MNTPDTVKKLAIFLSTSGHSGVDRVMKNLIPEIARRGIRIDLLKVKNHGPYLESVPEGVRIVELGSSHTYTSLMPLVRYLKTHQPEAMLSDKDKVNRVALIAAKLAGVNTKVSVRNGTTVSVDLKKRGWFDRKAHYISMHYLYRKAHSILTPSRGAADDLAQVANIPADRVTAVPSPAATPELYDKAKENIDHPWFADATTPVIIGVGELSPRKDFATLIHAFAQVREQRPCRLFILGKGKQYKPLTELIKQYELEQDILLAGFDKNPYRYMTRADLYVHSSRFEGSPVALMEAVALGTPCVSTDCPSGPRETLQNGRYGKLVPVGDVDAMAHAILESLANPMPRDEVKKAAERFTVEASATAYLKALGIVTD